MKKILIGTIIIFLAIIIATSSYLLSQQKQTPNFISPLGSIFIPSAENLRRSFIVYGYLPYWNLNKAQFPNAVTHVSFFSIPIHANGHLISDEAPMEPGYRQFKNGVLTKLQTLAPKAKLELTLTMMGQTDIATFLATPSAQTTFISDLTQIVKTEPISGINIDIEFVKEVNEVRRAQFTELMRTIYTTLKQINPDLHISVAVLADSAEKKRLTDISAIAPYTDHVVIMAYDFHRKSSETSGANAPLYGESDSLWGKSIMASAKSFTDLIPAQKIILGIPFYGYEWSVADTNAYNFTLPDTGSVATYERISKLLASGKATRHWDTTSFTPYLLYMDKGKQQQIYYEDAQSLDYKLELVKQANFGGIAIWAMGYEGDTTELWDTIAKTLN